MDVSVVIPIGPGHEDIARRAIASAQAQSVPVIVITVQDDEGRGAGWARNQGLSAVVTDWVIFLDADDWLEPTAVEKLMDAAVEHPGRYIYSDWLAGDRREEAPQTGFAWCGGTWHAITALLPTAWAKQTGGFDESLPGGEDTDFYLNLITSRRCGVRLPEPLLHYSADGQRGKSFVERPDFKELMQGIRDRYKERGQPMSCCGQSAAPAPADGSEKREGDILAIALWGGNRRESGRATGRIYPRTGNGKTAWVDPRDVAAAPQLWQRVDTGTDEKPPAEGVKAVANQVMTYMSPRIVSARYQPQRPPQPPVKAPDVAAIVRMAVEALDNA